MYTYTYIRTYLCMYVLLPGLVCKEISNYFTVYARSAKFAEELKMGWGSDEREAWSIIWERKNGAILALTLDPSVETVALLHQSVRKRHRDSVQVRRRLCYCYCFHYKARNRVRNASVVVAPLNGATEWKVIKPENKSSQQNRSIVQETETDKHKINEPS